MSWERENYELCKQNQEQYVKDSFINDPEERARIETIIQQVPRERTLLDVGCGYGVFLHLLKNHIDIFSVGLERSQNSLTVGKSMFDLNLVQGTADVLPFYDCSIDVITVLEVIEHLPYEAFEKSLQEIERVSRKWIIISVPFCEKRIFIRCPYCGCEFNPYYHFRSFTKKDLVNLFNKFNLVTVTGVIPTLKLPFIHRFLKIYRDKIQFFPELTICPACGYKRKSMTGAISTEQREKSLETYLTKLRQSKEWLLKKIPWWKQYRWIIACYKKK